MPRPAASGSASLRESVLVNRGKALAIEPAVRRRVREETLARNGTGKESMRGKQGFMRVWWIVSLLWLLSAGSLTFWLADLHQPVLTLWRIQGWDLTPDDCSLLTEIRREFCVAGNRLKVSMVQSRQAAKRDLGAKWWIPVVSAVLPPLLLLLGRGLFARGVRRTASVAPQNGSPPPP
jgi:hypothetical protein